MGDDLLTEDHVAALGLEDWRAAASAIEANFKTRDFVSGLRFVNAIGEFAEAANHHPDITLTYPSVHVLLTSHDAGGITQRDIDLARQISRAAVNQGIAPAR